MKCLAQIVLVLSAIILGFNARATTFYVDVNSTNPVPPYADWSTASTDIQSAVDASSDGDLILATNGLYNTGGQSLGSESEGNRVAVTKAVTIQSVNGPTVTVIQGEQVPVTINGYGAVRCVYLADNATLIGFTLTNGATWSAGNYDTEQSGGGIWCQSSSSVVSNCVLVGNSANIDGGGAYQGTLNNCVITNNQAPDGGGGVFLANLNDCILSGNSSFFNNGGGCLNGNLNNCTVVNNSGGGVCVGTYNNCIIYYNDVNYELPFSGGATVLNNCCTIPLPDGLGNITNDPAFVNLVAGDYHLSANSPCINSGDNDYVSVTNDLDGNPRIVGGTVDIGAYEYRTPTSIISYAWLQQYGLPTDGSADHTDSDRDGMSNYAEWIAGTNPTNAASVLLVASPTNSVTGITVTWQSVNTRTYYLQSSTNLPAFNGIQSNLVGQAGSTSFTDTTATNGGPYFYRIGVQ